MHNKIDVKKVKMTYNLEGGVAEVLPAMCAGYRIINACNHTLFCDSILHVFFTKPSVGRVIILSCALQPDRGSTLHCCLLG